MSNNVIAGITAFVLGFCLVNCAKPLQDKLFGCDQSSHQYCPTK